MENRKRTDHQSLIYRELNTHRVKTAMKRSKLMYYMKNEDDHYRQTFINQLFFRFTGLERDYFNDFYAVVIAMTIMIPSWRIKKMWKMGEFHRVILEHEDDETPDFICRFISPNPLFVLMYAIMTVYLLEITERLEKIEEVAVQKNSKTR